MSDCPVCFDGHVGSYAFVGSSESEKTELQIEDVHKKLPFSSSARQVLSYSTKVLTCIGKAELLRQSFFSNKKIGKHGLFGKSLS